MHNLQDAPRATITGATGLDRLGDWKPDNTKPDLPASMLMRVLDETDHGSIVVDCSARILHANHVARFELARGDLILQLGGVLVGVEEDASEKIHGAIEMAQRGRRSLLTIKRDHRDVSLAFLPLSHPLENDDPLVLVQLSRLPPSDNMALTMFARAQELSPTEESVMMALCKGWDIPDIAKSHRVAESTIRSQIKSIREKTGSNSIRRLLQWLHSLPPVVKALQSQSVFKHNAPEL